MTKAVRYYCPHCRKTLTRHVERANPKYRSYCMVAGGSVWLRKRRT